METAEFRERDDREKAEWTPRRGVADIVFDRPIAPYVTSGRVTLNVLLSQDDGDEVYDCNAPSLTIYVEGGLIDTVSCKVECSINGVNLIGLNRLQFERQVGCSAVGDPDWVVIDGEEELVLEYEQVVAQVWLRKGRVVTVIVGGVPED